MRKKYKAIDLAKFVMAIQVVAIHVRPFSGEAAFVYNDILARIADPLFFTITSFLFFEKVFQGCGSYRDFSWKTLGEYMRRILLLYTAWAVIYLPIVLPGTWKETIWHTDHFTGCPRVLELLLLLMKKFWLSGFYGALWFLTALLLAMPLTFAMTKFLGPKRCLGISAPFFLLTVCRMEYSGITDPFPIMQKLDQIIEEIFGWYGNGLTYGFFFCAVGMFLAWKRKEGIRCCRRPGICVLIGLFLLVIESYLIREKELGQSYGAMFMLIPVSYFLLVWLLEEAETIPVIQGFLQEREALCVHLRKLSILIFTIHYGVMDLLEYMAESMFFLQWNRTALYVAVLTITIGIAEMILALGRKWRVFRILY